MTKLDQDITGIDIFSPTAWWPEDEIVKRDLGVQRRRLRALLQSAPAEDASDAGVELEDWCRQWKDVTESMKRLIKLANKHKMAEGHVTDAERQAASSGRQIYARLQRELNAMKAAAADEAEGTAQAPLPAEQERLAQVSKNNGEERRKKEKEANAQLEGNSQLEEDDNAQEDDALEESPIKRSARVHTSTKISPQVESDSDIDIIEMAPNQAEPVARKKIVARADINNNNSNSNSNSNSNNNVVPCTSCAGLQIDCVRTEGGHICEHFHHPLCLRHRKSQ
ncbi:hypothetical protein BD769DRAFT_1741623 [Suillus cothurnatus]|nr:hypothetical protein BD769DRAFT_1741623 [Suillus cothurnatus]